MSPVAQAEIQNDSQEEWHRAFIHDVYITLLLTTRQSGHGAIREYLHKMGEQRNYSDPVIATVMMIKRLCRLTLWAAQDLLIIFRHYRGSIVLPELRQTRNE